jgi:Mrp family chromosome partitioning ATPase
LLAELRSQFDAVIVDTPALTAGIDGFALGAECGNILLVMRCARTDLRATMMKLDILRRLPVNIHGVVLNDVQPTGEYRYYAYETSYAGVSETAVVKGNGAGKNGKGSGKAPQRRVLGAG